VQERDPFEEISNVLALGLLSEEMVLVVGRVLRKEPLSERDRRVVEDAKRLFQALRTESVLPTDPRMRRLPFNDAYREALNAVKVRVPDTDEVEAAAYLVELLNAVLAGSLDPAQASRLEQLRGIFTDLGKAMLLRATTLSRTRQEPGRWNPTPAPSGS